MIEELEKTIRNKRAEADKKRQELDSKINEVLESNIEIQQDIRKANKVARLAGRLHTELTMTEEQTQDFYTRARLDTIVNGQGGLRSKAGQLRELLHRNAFSGEQIKEIQQTLKSIFSDFI